jgi:hypothetical protein
LFAIGVLLALSPLIIRALAYEAEHRVARMVAALAATGAPTRATQVAKPSIPAAENAALVYRQAFDVMQMSDDERTLLSEVASGRTSVSDRAVAAQVQGVLKRNAKTLALVRRAAAMPRCNFEVDRTDWGYRYSASKHRRCFLLLNAQSRIQLQAGQGEEALPTCMAALRAANAANEPLQISQLLRYGMISQGSATLAAILQEAPPPPGQCRALAKEIASVDLSDSWTKALITERARDLSSIEDVRSGKSSLGDLLDVNTRVDPHRPFMRWMLAADEIRYLAAMNRLVRNAPLPYRKLDDGDGTENRHRGRIPPAIITGFLGPFPIAGQPRRDQAMADLGLAEIALLLRAYHGTQGRYPDTLAELARIIDHPVPDDPFSGKPFVYRRQGNGFLLYGWGSNLKDDGGRSPSPKDESGGDMVVRFAR